MSNAAEREHMHPPITKLDIVGHHITASIQLIAIGANPFTGHLAAMAVEEMLRGIADARDTALRVDFRRYIKTEHQRQYTTQLRKAYNWLKHADRDASSVYDGPPSSVLVGLNEIQTAMNIAGHVELGAASNPVHLQFLVLMSVKHPNYFNIEFLEAYPPLKEQYFELDRDPETLQLALQEMLRGHSLLPGLA